MPIHEKQQLSIEECLAQTYDTNPQIRKQAVHELCPCNLKANYVEVWDRLLAMVADPDPKVRSMVFHTLADGSPREREQDIIQAIEKMRNDPDLKLRRRVRSLLAHHRNGGRLNIL